MACLRVSSMLLPLAAAIVCVHVKNCVACARRVWTFDETGQVIEHRAMQGVLYRVRSKYGACLTPLDFVNGLFL